MIVYYKQKHTNVRAELFRLRYRSYFSPDEYNIVFMTLHEEEYNI
jgi:hypothetical protein